jgi:hypothetical protein
MFTVRHYVTEDERDIFQEWVNIERAVGYWQDWQRRLK